MDNTNATPADIVARMQDERTLEGFLGNAISDVTALVRTWTKDTAFNDLPAALKVVSPATTFLAMVGVGISPWDAREELQWQHLVRYRELISGLEEMGISKIAARDILGMKQSMKAVAPIEARNMTFCPNCGLEWPVERVGKVCLSGPNYGGCGEVIRKPVLR